MVREHRAADPILPMDLMIRPMIAASVIGNFLIGGILFGIETYVPLYMQGRARRRRQGGGPGADAAVPGLGDQRGLRRARRWCAGGSGGAG